MVAGSNWFETEEGKQAAANIHLEIPIPRSGVLTVVKNEFGTDFFIGFPVAQQSVHWTAYAVCGLAIMANFIIGWFVFRGIIRRQ